MPRKSRTAKLRELQDWAKELGGACLSITYVNPETKLEWRCKEGHTWQASANQVKDHHHWCPICADEGQRLGLQEMQGIARSRGGQCLSTVYVNAVTKLEWRCREGHTWSATPQSVKNQETWCAICANLAKRGQRKKHILTIEEMQEIARRRGGKCLSTHYVNSYTHLSWECAEGHTWSATPNDVKNHETWCRICAEEERRLGLEEMQEIARQRKGTCLSTAYVNANTKLRWQCEEGHIWQATPESIKHQGTWCAVCDDLAKRLGLGEMQKIARERGGECLSTEYVDNQTKLKWRCNKGHTWDAVPDMVRNRGTWCPFCAREK